MHEMFCAEEIARWERQARDRGLTREWLRRDLSLATPPDPAGRLRRRLASALLRVATWLDPAPVRQSALRRVPRLNRVDVNGLYSSRNS